MAKNKSFNPEPAAHKQHNRLNMACAAGGTLAYACTMLFFGEPSVVDKTSFMVGALTGVGAMVALWAFLKIFVPQWKRLRSMKPPTFI